MSTWSELAERAIIPFGADGINKKAYATQLLKDAEEDFALFTKCLEKTTVLWTGTDVADGNLVVGTEYMNAGYDTVVHDGNTYTEGETFTAVNANYTKTGTTGKVVASSEDVYTVALPSDYLEIKEKPTWNGTPLGHYSHVEGLELRNTTEGTWYISTPDDYFIESEQLWLVPGSDSNGRIDFVYIAKPAGAGSSPEINAAYHNYLVNYAKALLYLDKGEATTYDRLLGKYERSKQLIKSQIFNSDDTDTYRIRSVASSPVRVDRL